MLRKNLNQIIKVEIPEISFKICSKFYKLNPVKKQFIIQIITSIVELNVLIMIPSMRKLCGLNSKLSIYI
jgi:hypothetical protein